MPPASSCKRSARRRNWSGDSSPETYSVAMPWLSSRAAHCMRSVDLPMPGSPPTRTTEPGTMPPPKTKSNSANSVHRKTEWALDTAGLEGGSLARRVVVEARVFLLEVQLHGAGGAIALFPDDHLRNALDAIVCFGIHRAVVELLPIDEADD